MKDRNVENIGYYRQAKVGRASSTIDVGLSAAPTVMRNTSGPFEVRGEGASANFLAPIIEPYPPLICIAIILAISVALWAMIISLVLAMLS